MSYMDIEEIYLKILSDKTRGMSFQEAGDGLIVKLPFSNFMGEPIEVYIGSDKGHIILEDLGQTAGCLFSTNQYTETAEGHRLLKNIVNTHRVTMDYNRGVLRKELTEESNIAEFYDFAKILVAVNAVVPEFRHPRKALRRRPRLASRLVKDVEQLKLPMLVQKHAEIQGRKATWIVEFKYSIVGNGAASDIFVSCADLSLKKPIDEAAYVLAMAMDIQDIPSDNKQLRVVYNLNGGSPESLQASELISENQERFRYSAFNYSDINDRNRWTDITRQELALISEGRAPLL